MIDRAATAEQIGNAVIAGDVGRDSYGVELGRDRIQPLDVSGGDDDIGAFPLGEFGGRKTDAG